MARRHIRARLLVLTLAFACRAAQAAPEATPNFAPDDHTSWFPDRPDADNFLPPENGPGPVVSRPGYPYVPNGDETDFAATNPTYRVADITNPILQPWVVAQMKRDNEEVIAGKIPFTARERCYPGGVPGWDVFRRVAPPMLFFIQTPEKVLMIWRGDNQVRRVYMNVPHSTNVKPSWYGESVGHYENGDTLVVDTIGLNDKSYVDNYRTPHTTQLHVVERFRLTDNDKTIEVSIHVEDPSAFTTPWNARQVLSSFGGSRTQKGTLDESSCAESGSLPQFDYGNYGASHVADLVPVPKANKPDF